MARPVLLPWLHSGEFRLRRVFRFAMLFIVFCLVCLLRVRV